MTVQAGGLPTGLLLSWYGDDFTGSAAVMEALAFAGIDSVLFLGLPSVAQRRRFAHVRSLGIAGTARSRSPAWMQRELPAIYRYLHALQAPVTQYKVCSTLDSSPTIGSIGTAIDLAQPIFASRWVPFFAATPAIERYQAFGHFFAGAAPGVYRIDRHPVMARHPITPMTESDVRRHLQCQTDRPIGLIDLRSLKEEEKAKRELTRVLDSGAEIVAIDAMSDSELAVVGALLWPTGPERLFAVGSQGIEYALIAHWQSKQWLAPTDPVPGAGTVAQIIVASGSVSPTTQAQIDWSLEHGFAGIEFDATTVCAGAHALENQVAHCAEKALKQIAGGASALIYTARGPDDPAVARYLEALANGPLDAQMANQQLGVALGRVVERVLRRSGLRRAVISGGDTSGHATSQLGVYALTALAPTIPGAALFQAHSDDPSLSGLQLALKGGQMGTEDYFEWIRRGGGLAPFKETPA